MTNKKILVITDEEQSYIPIATVIVDSNIDLEEVELNIQATKDRLFSEWTVSDILENLEIDYEELEFDCQSV